MRKSWLVLLSAFWTGPAWSVAGEETVILGNIYAQTLTMVEQLNSSLKELQDSVDISKNLESLELVKNAKGVIATTEGMATLIDELSNTIELGQGLLNTRSSIKGDIEEMISDVDDLVNKFEDAKDGRNTVESMKRYANALRGVKRLKVLSKANTKTLWGIEKEGINDSDAMRISAKSNTMALQLAIEKAANEEAKNAEAIDRRMRLHNSEKQLFGSYKSLR